MIQDQLIFQRFGEAGLLINWPAKIDPLINDQVLLMDEFIRSTFQKEIIESVPTYHSLAVYVKEEVDVLEFIQKIKSTPISVFEKKSDIRNVITIPVCYKPVFAQDIENVASKNKISVNEVIRLHTQAIYKVYFLGFLPGFPYLSGLDEKLHTPRKSIPSKFNDKGSVAIGGSQTGIYTTDSPGGWNIIGRTPLDFFGIYKQLFSLLSPGDYVKFTVISIKKFEKIAADVAIGKYQVQKEVLND